SQQPFLMQQSAQQVKTPQNLPYTPPSQHLQQTRQLFVQKQASQPHNSTSPNTDHSLDNRQQHLQTLHTQYVSLISPNTNSSTTSLPKRVASETPSGHDSNKCY